LRDVPDVGDLVADFSDFSLDVVGGYGIMHVPEYNLVGAVFLWFVGMEGLW
jgi:hypothetical protein